MSVGDFFSSARGPGLVGMVLAIVVLAGFILLGTLTLDERFQGGGVSADSQLRDNEVELAELKEQLAATDQKLKDYASRERQAMLLDDLNIKIAHEKGSQAELQEKIADANSAIREVEERIHAYKERYRAQVRGAAAGTTLDSLTTTEGITYQQVTITHIGAVGVNIQHKDGTGRIPFELLPAEMQEYYQYEPEQAEQVRVKEQDERMQHLLAGEAADKAAQRDKEQKDAERASKEAAERARMIDVLSRSIEKLQEDIERMESRISQEAYKGISRAPQMRQELDAMRKRKAEMEHRLNQLRMAL